jgi:hypothetical protein
VTELKQPPRTTGQPSPESTIRGYLDDHGGETDATVDHLLLTFGISEGDLSGRDEIVGALSSAGVQIDPPLPFLSASEDVHLSVGTAPLPRTAPQSLDATPRTNGRNGDSTPAPSNRVVGRPAALIPPTPGPPPAPAHDKRLNRPVTYGGLLVALLATVVLFAGVAAAAVLAIDDPGPRGHQGVQGVQGPQGVQGKRGKPGKNGLNGANGAPGAPGATRACSNDLDVPLPYC